MTEIETTVKVMDVQVGDHLYVGHGWWGRVESVDHAINNLWLLLVGGVEFSIAVVGDEPVVVRRSAAEEASR